MNAEFLGKDIVIRFTTIRGGKRVYTADNVRKNLAPISFIGAVAVTEDGTQAYRITEARSDSIVRYGVTLPVVQIQAGPYLLTYSTEYGSFVRTPID